jgi:hypothetical protein
MDIPSNGATLTGIVTLEATGYYNPSALKFELTGGSYAGQVVAIAEPTVDGWLAQEPNGTWGWDSTSVPNGTYTLTPVVTINGQVVTGVGITVSVSNPAPTAQIRIPSSGAVLSGTTFLDGKASYPHNINHFVYEMDGAPIGTAIRTIYGWLLKWNTTTVTDGSHTLTVLVMYADSATATSQGISVTVLNHGSHVNSGL